MRKVIYLLTVAAMLNTYAEEPAKETSKEAAKSRPQATSKRTATKALPKRRLKSIEVNIEEKARLLELEKTSKKAIVIIKGKSGSGTGFVADFWGRKVIITNMHVIKDNKNLKFLTQSGQELKPKSLFFAKDRDLSIFELDDTSIAPLKIEPKVGALSNSTQVVVYGNSLGESIVTTVKGTLQGTGPTEIESDAKFVNGNSGSPIIDLSTGKVIGVATRATCLRSWTTDGTKFKVRRFGTRIDNVTWDDFQQYDKKKYEHDLYLLNKLINSITIAYQVLAYFERFYGKEPDEFASGLRKQIIHLHCMIKNDSLKNIPEFKPIYRRWNQTYVNNESRLENHERIKSDKNRLKKSYSFSAFNDYKPVETDIHILIDVR